MSRSDFRKALVLSLGACAALVAACTEDGAEFAGVDTAGTGGAGSPNAGAPSNAGAAKGGSSGMTGTAGMSQGGKAPMGGTSNAGTGGSVAGSTHAGSSGTATGGASGGEGGSSGEGGTSGEGGASSEGGAGGQGGDPTSNGGASGEGSGGEGGAGTVVICEAAEYTTAVPTSMQALEKGNKITLTMKLQADAPRDVIELELYDGNGVFAAGLKPGTYEIQGNDLDLKYCNLCVRFYDQRNIYGGDRGWYMATGGTLTLTSVEDNLTGSLTNVTFLHSYQENSGHSVPWEDGCTTKVDKVEFNTAIVPN